MLKDCMKDCIREIWSIHEVIFCQNMLYVHFIQMVLFKDEYSLVIYCKCLNEEIKLLFALKFSQKISLTTATMGYHRFLNISILSQPLLNRSFYQGMVRLFCDHSSYQHNPGRNCDRSFYQ